MANQNKTVKVALRMTEQEAADVKRLARMAKCGFSEALRRAIRNGVMIMTGQYK